MLCSPPHVVGKGIFMVRCGRTGFDRDQVCPLYRFKSKVQLRPPYTVALTDLGARTPTFSHFSPSPARHNVPILPILFGTSCRRQYLPLHIKKYGVKIGGKVGRRGSLCAQMAPHLLSTRRESTFHPLPDVQKI